MLEYGETFKMRKEQILFDIRWSADMLSILQRCIITFPKQVDDFRQTTLDMKEYNQAKVQELIALKRWRMKNNIKEDEVWLTK